MKLGKILGAALLATTAMGSAVQAADVVIGVPNWPSVRVTAHVLKVVMEDNLGVEVEKLSSGSYSFKAENIDLNYLEYTSMSGTSSTDMVK